MSKKKGIELFVEGTIIVDHQNRKVTVDQARTLWEGGKVKNCNLSFKRLATLAGWDFVELERQYREMDSANNR